MRQISNLLEVFCSDEAGCTVSRPLESTFIWLCYALLLSEHLTNSRTLLKLIAQTRLVHAVHVRVHLRTLLLLLLEYFANLNLTFKLNLPHY